jgi:hypothetical protein
MPAPVGRHSAFALAILHMLRAVAAPALRRRVRTKLREAAFGKLRGPAGAGGYPNRKQQATPPCQYPEPRVPLRFYTQLDGRLYLKNKRAA